MRLVDVLEGTHGQVTNGFAAVDSEITGLTCDSRRVEPGFLFAALPGTQVDGRAFIPEALSRGAVAVLAPPGTVIEANSDVSLVTNDNPRREYALMAARFFAEQSEIVVAVTGTNGKTSVVSFLRHIWGGLGCNAASAGTLGIELTGLGPGEAPSFHEAAHLTTPDPVDLHRSLFDLAKLGVERLALEASSHGLAQYRLDGLRIAAAAFTNLTRDHLDYHGAMVDYLGAKIRLFSEILVDGGTAVVNTDSDYSDAVIAASRGRGHRVLTYGSGAADIQLTSIQPLPDGQRLEVQVLGHTMQLTLPLVGGFQASNALCALALAIAVGDDPEAAADQLQSLQGAPGRVELVGCHTSGAPVFVDYAHTPDALASVLKALRLHTSGDLHVVFGCGGDRDPGKRPEMGDVACKLADAVIVTDDNPRTEDPAAIRAQIIATCPGATEIGDRAEAIAEAVRNLQSGDLLVVAGKGHETGQTIGDDVRPFDDADVVRAALEEPSQ